MRRKERERDPTAKGREGGRERGNYSGDIDPAATRQPLSLDSFGSTPTHLPTRLHSVYLFTSPSLSPSLFVTPAISSSTSYFSSFASSSFPPPGYPIFVLFVVCCAWCGSTEFTSRSPNPRASTREREREEERLNVVSSARVFSTKEVPDDDLYVVSMNLSPRDCLGARCCRN